MATQFRQLGPDDGDHLVERLIGWYRSDGRILSARPARREATRILADSHGWHAWLIEHQGAVVGYLMITFQNSSLLQTPRARVAALYLAPEMRGRGVGRQATRFVADLARWLQVRITDGECASEDRHASALTRTAVTAPWSLDLSPRQVTA